MKNLLGPHLAGNWISNIDELTRWQPPLVLVLQPKYEEIKELKNRCPKTIIIGRHYHDDAHYASNIMNRPIQFAQEIHNEIMNTDTYKLLDYIQTNNEVCQDWAGTEKLNEFSLAWMRLADKDKAYKCAILSLSVGNFDLPNKPNDPAGFNGRLLYWQRVYQSLLYAQNNDHILNLHAYGWDTMFKPDENWYIYRYESQVQDYLKQININKLKYFYGEIGIDRLIVGEKGGYKVITDDSGYAKQLIKWEQDQQNESLLLGGAIFTYGDSGGWSSYDIKGTNVPNLIIENKNNNGNKPDMNNNIYIPKVENNPQIVPPVNNLEWDERLTKRGTKYQLYNPKPNEGYWKLLSGKYLDEKEHIFIDLLDENGKHIYNKEIIIYWTTGQTKIKTEDKSKDPYALGDANFRMDNLGCSYNIKFDEYSDLVLCDGLGSDIEPNYKIHRSSKYIYQWTLFEQETVKPNPTPPPSKEESVTRYVIANPLNIREQPNTDSKIVGLLPYGTPVKTIAKMGDWYQLSTNQWIHSSWTQATKPLDVSQPLPTANTEVERFKAYLARILNIDLKLLNAVLKIESGNRFWNELNKPYIRVELHLIKQCMDENTFNKFFKYGGDSYKIWENHYWRKSENDEWIQAHTTQVLEYQLLEFASQFGKECIYQNMSMGMSQTMGFHFKKLGYSSAVDMFEKLSQSEIEQLVVFFDFLGETGALEALQNNDLKKFIAIYNGEGQVQHYYNLIMNEINK